MHKKFIACFSVSCVGYVQISVIESSFDQSFESSVYFFFQCIWKMIKMVPEIINDLAVDRILLETHLFLRNFPTSTWKNRTSDLPLRTIKTVIHTLAMLKGSKVRNYV